MPEFHPYSGKTGTASQANKEVSRATEYDFPCALIESTSGYSGVSGYSGYAGSLGTTYDADVAYGVAVIDNYDQTTHFHRVKRPDADSASAGICVIMPGAYVQRGQIFQAALSPKRWVIAAYDGTAPAIGGSLGTQKDSFTLKVGNTGFICGGIVNSSKQLCLVRATPGGGGGGSTNLILVQAAANGSGGVVSTKVMTLKTNPAASPNFTLATAADNLYYLHL
jgi:hypothetical protein